MTGIISRTSQRKMGIIRKTSQRKIQQEKSDLRYEVEWEGKHKGRKIQGKRYFLDGRFTNKVRAKKKAIQLRKKGFRVRIIRTKYGYGCFKRNV